MKKILVNLLVILIVMTLSSCSQNIDQDLDYEDVTFTGELIFSQVGENEYSIVEYKGSDTYLILPDTYMGNPITRINQEVFKQRGITHVEIGKYVDTIGESAFFSTKITSITIPDSVTTIGAWAFDFLGLDIILGVNSHFKIEDGLLLSRDGTILVAAVETMTSITLPDTVTTIEKWAFIDNNLTSVTIPESVTNIGYWAFRRNDLTSVTIFGDKNRFYEEVFEFYQEEAYWAYVGIPIDLIQWQ